MVRYVLDKMNLEEGDRRTESLIKSAVNDAYIDIAKLDCTVKDIVYPSPDTRTLELPEDFLIDLQVSCDSFGKLSDSQYQVMGSTLVLTKDILQQGDICLTYGVYPEPLKEDVDEPIVRKDYHRAMCYHALYELTEQDTYMELYVSVIDSIPEFEPFLDEGIDEEIVRNVY